MSDPQTGGLRRGAQITGVGRCPWRWREREDSEDRGSYDRSCSTVTGRATQQRGGGMRLNRCQSDKMAATSIVSRFDVVDAFPNSRDILEGQWHCDEWRN